MSFTLTFQNPVLLFCIVWQVRALSIPPHWRFELPELDGSAVENNCRNVFDTTPTPLTVEPATPAATRMQLMETTPKPSIRSPQKPEPTRTRTQPAVRGPLSRDAVLRLLHLLLANSRGGAARPPRKGGVSSSSEESAAFRKVQTFPSKRSSEES